jgi:HD-like signal output (HDOD) protein
MSHSLNGIVTRCLVATAHTFPQTIIRIRRLSQDPNCSMPLISRILRSDPMLAATILGRGAIGSLHEVFTLDDAIAKLGLAGVQGMTLEVNPLQVELHQILSEHWTRANACALMVGILGKKCSVDFQEREYPIALHVAGLLHDLGAIMAVILFSKEFAKADIAVAHSSHYFTTCFKSAMGVSQYSVGALVAKSWHLPEYVQAAIRWWPSPEIAKHHPAIAHLVHIARNLTQAVGFTAGHDIYVELIRPASMHALNLSQRDLLLCLQEFLNRIDEIPQYDNTADLAPSKNTQAS